MLRGASSRTAPSPDSFSGNSRRGRNSIAAAPTPPGCEAGRRDILIGNRELSGSLRSEVLAGTHRRRVPAWPGHRGHRGLLPALANRGDRRRTPRGPQAPLRPRPLSPDGRRHAHSDRDAYPAAGAGALSGRAVASTRAFAQPLSELESGWRAPARPRRAATPASRLLKKGVRRRYERRGVRCKEPRRRRCSCIGEERRRRRWPYATLGCGGRLAAGSREFSKRRP
jgi:hypothetical protein